MYKHIFDHQAPLENLPIANNTISHIYIFVYVQKALGRMMARFVWSIVLPLGKGESRSPLPAYGEQFVMTNGPTEQQRYVYSSDL